MADAIDKYAWIGDLGSGVLVSRGGSMDWLCWPDFDSEACFAALLGGPEHGYWSLEAPQARRTTREYLPRSLVLRTTHESFPGRSVTVTDFMPVRDKQSTIVRIVRGAKGRTQFRTCLLPRFDYGAARPRVEPDGDGCWNITSGPHRLTLRSNVALSANNDALWADWTVGAGECSWFTLQYSNSYRDPRPECCDAVEFERQTLEFWRDWSSRTTYSGPYAKTVERSLITLKALTYKPSGGFVAAPTTSLPEKIGGIRNWDYRFCWLRDTTFSLLGLIHGGHREEAREWLEWLARSIQGDPSDLKTLYGITGKREHSEWTAGWLRGYQNSTPVHIGNKASSQLQLDTYGEVLDVLYRARQHGLYPREDKSGEALETRILARLETIWADPDEGLWEFRSGPRQFTESKVMAWVAFDRGVRMVEQFGVKGPVDRWRAIRGQIHAQVCERGFHKRLNSFTMDYGSKHLDASLLMLPLVGFLPPNDPRIVGTVKAIERSLMRGGLLLRYDTARVDDGLPSGEGAFLACNFWLVDVYVAQGRLADARKLFERLLKLSNDVGLLSEEYDRKHGLIGNFPQAFSHIGLLNAAYSLNLGTSTRLHGLR